MWTARVPEVRSNFSFLKFLLLLIFFKLSFSTFKEVCFQKISMPWHCFTQLQKTFQEFSGAIWNPTIFFKPSVCVCVRVCAHSHLIYMQGDAVSDFQLPADRPDVEDVAASDLRVLHRELHPLKHTDTTTAFLRHNVSIVMRKNFALRWGVCSYRWGYKEKAASQQTRLPLLLDWWQVKLQWTSTVLGAACLWLLNVLGPEPSDW